MSLTSCFTKAGDALRAEDRQAIADRALELRAQYRADGLSASEATGLAERQAVTERLEAVRAEQAADESRTLDQSAQGKKEQPRDLVIQHNLTVENLMHAARMGGIPVPSLAVTKADAPMVNFGEITLIGPQEMADPKGYAGTKVFGADIYSPRYPTVTFDFKPAQQKALERELADGMKATDSKHLDWSELAKGPRELSRVAAFAWTFAKSQGIEPQIVKDGDRVDRYRTLYAIDNQLRAKDLIPALEQAARDTFERIAPNERIFQGFTNMGNRRYTPHTLEKVVSILKKELRGGEGFNYGVGSLRAKFTPQFKSVAAIRNAKDRLVTKESFEEIKKEIDRDLMAISDSFGHRSLETTISMIEDSMKMSVDRAAKEYNKDAEVTPEQKQAVYEFMTRLRNLPTQYFEAKILRDVDVAEFKVAVVPSGMPEKARTYLESRGVKLVEYAKGDDADRAAKIKQAAVENDALFQSGADAPRAQIKFPADLTSGPAVISLLEGADWSSYIHENAHAYLEIHSDLARRIQAKIAAGEDVSDGEKAIVADVAGLLKWFGITGSPEQSALDAWAMMTLEEKRAHHETFARGFEKYAMEGKAPTLELQSAFQKFAGWLKQVYTYLKNLNVTLDDDVRAIMGRMIATDEVIAEAEQARGLLPMIQSAEDAAKLGWSQEKYAAYQAMAEGPTAAAVEQLQGRALRDMKWLSRARTKALKDRQAEVEEQRREIRAEIRMEVYAEPVYRAWQFLTGKPLGAEDKATGAGRVKDSKSVDPERDSLLTAIAKLGGVSRESAKRDLDVSDDDLTAKPEIFGKPLWRKEGGMTADHMRKSLTELGYLHDRDEFGRTDLSGLRAAVADEIGGSPSYSFAKRYDEDAPRDVIGEGQFYGKLNAEELRARYGTGEAAIWRKLSALRMTSETGISADVLAESILDRETQEPAFDSGDALVQALAAAMPPREVIEARTDARMLEMFGDITSPEALARAADEAVLNKVRAKFLASEWKALEDATTKKVKTGKRTVDVLALAAKEYAAQIVGKLKVRDIKPAKYAAAMARNGKLSMKAFTAGKLEESAMHKRNQTVNAYAAEASYDALREVEKALAYLRKFDKRIKALDPAYQDQIEAILERFDLRKASRDEAAKARAEARTQAQIAAAEARLKELDDIGPSQERKGLADWLASMDPDKGDIIPSLPESVANEANRKSYKDMTVEELRSVVDAVQHLDHLGRTKKRLLNAKIKRDLDAYAADAAASIRKSKDVREVDREGEPAWRDNVAHGAATLRKMSSLARQMDAGDESGPLFEGLVRPANEAGAWEDERMATEVAELSALVAEVAALPGGLTTNESKQLTPMGVSLTRGARLAVLLNAGNETNLQRLQGGDGWGMAQVQALAATMTPTELNFVNKSWSYINRFWPEVAALEKRMTGVVPEKVEAVPFVVTASDGTKIVMTGGYYPVAYSPDLNEATAKQESAKELIEAARGAVSRGMTRHGHTKHRSEKVDRKLRLDLGVMSSHVEQVVHDLAWREWVTDANRILNHKEIAGAMLERYGRRVVDAMREQVAAIASGDKKPRDAWHKGMMWARNNASRAVMGFSATTAFLQPFGVLQSVVRVGAGPVLTGFRRWAGDAAQMESSMTWITQKSTFMKNRAKTFNREVSELNRLMSDKSKAAAVMDTALFWTIQKMQLVADVPTWIGQYEKTLKEASERAKAEGRSGDEVLTEIEAEAVAQADRAVIEAQGSGEVKDLAGVQRNWPMLTMFYSYFSATWQMTVESTARTNFRSPRAVAGWLGDMMLLNVIPAIGPALLLTILKGMGGDDEEKARKLAEKAAESQYSYLLNMIPLVREAQGIMGPFDYQGPPPGMIVGALGKAVKQTKQVVSAYAEDGLDAAAEQMDEAFVKSYIRLLGLSFGLPVVQAQRMWDGWKAWDEGKEGAGPQSVLFGPPPKD